jgi:hypothetical protein
MNGPLVVVLVLSLASAPPGRDGERADEVSPAPAPAAADGADGTSAPRAPSAADLGAILLRWDEALSALLRLEPPQRRGLRRLLQLELDRHLAAASLRSGGGPGRPLPAARGGRGPGGGPAAGRGVRSAPPPAGRDGAAPPAAKTPAAPTAEGRTPDAKTPVAKASDAPTSDAPTSDAPPSDTTPPGAKPADMEQADVDTADAEETEAKAAEAKGRARARVGPDAAFGVLTGADVHPAVRGLRLTTLSALLRLLEPEQVPVFGRLVGARGVLQLRQLALARRMLAPRARPGGGKGRKGGGKRGRKGGGRRIF